MVEQQTMNDFQRRLAQRQAGRRRRRNNPNPSPSPEPQAGPAPPPIPLPAPPPFFFFFLNPCLLSVGALPYVRQNLQVCAV